MRRKIFVLTLVSLFLFSAQPAQAENPLQKWFPFLFPQQETGPRPEETLQAPFSTGAPDVKQIPGGEAWQENSESTLGLDVSHRATREISEWAVTAVSQALTFESDDYQVDLQKLKTLFDEPGYAQYTAFLQDNKIMNVLTSGKFYVRSFVQDSPLLLNEGAVDGRFRWLYEIPVMISYMDRDMTNYDKAEPVSQKLVLRVQLGRKAESPDNPHGLLIESWTGKLQKLDKQ